MTRLLAIGFSVLMLVGFSANAVAWDKSDLDKLRKTNECQTCDLAGVNLTGANLAEANLKHANLTKANLGGANLTQAKLNGAVLTGANLTGANLKRANLYRTNLRKVNLSYAELFAANLGEADLTGANLAEANLKHANLYRAHLSGAKLTGVNLTGADLTYATLHGTKLTGVNLTGADLRYAILHRENLTGAILCQTIMQDGSTDNSGCGEVATTVPSTASSSNLQNGLTAYYEGAYSEAYRFLAPLAIQGDPRTQVRVANMLIKAHGVQRDEEEAIRLFSIALQPVQLSASNGEAWAQSDLGDYFHDGWVIEKDYRNAVYWYRRAAEQGYAPAQNTLGWLYMQGHGVSPDEELAIKWFRRAAEQGDVAALDNLKVLGVTEQSVNDVGPIFRILETKVNLHSDIPGAVIVKVRLLNRSTQHRSYPAIELALSDRNGQIVGRRTYSPESFLITDDFDKKVPAGADVIVVLNLAQPEDNAVGFEPRIADLSRSTALEFNAQSMELVHEQSARLGVRKALDCLRVGPFSTEETYSRASRLLVNRGYGFTRNIISARELRAFRVYLGPFKNTIEQDESAKKLDQMGLSYYTHKDETGTLLSIQMFTQGEEAGRYVAELTVLGLDANSKAEVRTLGPLRWLEVADVVNEERRQSLATLDWADSTVRLAPVLCGGEVVILDKPKVLKGSEKDNADAPVQTGFVAQVKLPAGEIEVCTPDLSN